MRVRRAGESPKRKGTIASDERAELFPILVVLRRDSQAEEISAWEFLSELTPGRRARSQ